MAAKVDDTAEPRRRIPDHPPYSLMIGEAIRSLNEEQGSTESSISEYIKANFDGLPWGHDRLLPYYLNKLVAQGEFVNGATDRYLLAYDDDCDAKDGKIVTLSPTNIKGRGEFVRKNRSKDDVGTMHLQSVASPVIEPEIKDGNLDEDEGVPIACEGDLVIEVQSSAMPETYKTDVFDENSKLAASSNSEVITESMPKRCGRWPNRRESLIGGSAVASEPIASNCDDFQILKTLSSQKEPNEAEEDCVLVQSEQAKNSTFGALGSASVHKRRGRPPRLRDAESMEWVASISLGTKDNASEPQVLEDRGATRMAQNQEDGSKQAPKKLGRPWKRKHQALKDGSKEANIHAEDVNTMQLVDLSSLCVNVDSAIEPQVTGDRSATRMVQNQEDGSKQVPKRLRRPRKRKDQALEAIVRVGYVNTLQLVNPSSLCTNDDARNKDDKSKSVSKRRGRPPKTKNEDVEMMRVTNPSSLHLNIDVTKNPTENQTYDMDGSKSVPKKVGRPPKSKKSSTPNGDPVDLLDHIDPKCKVELQKWQKESYPMPKHHGSTSKSMLELVAKKDESNLATETSGKSEENNSTCVPKGRGRPPKPKLDLKVDMHVQSSYLFS